MSRGTRLAFGLALAGVIALVYASGIFAGPLSGEQVRQLVHGVPTDRQEISCASAATTPSVVPAGSLVRIAAEAAGIFYQFGPAGTVPTINSGFWLPKNVVEVVQNGASSTYVFCIARGAASMHVAVLR